jgi:predicted transcriptional regulator
MMLSAKEAAELVGMTKQGIIRAIHKGTISAGRGLHNEFVIDPAELDRVYKRKTTTVNSDTTVVGNLNQDRVNVLETQVMMLEQMVADKDETIRKLFDRLEAQQQVTLLLEDKQRRVSWWQRVLGR